MNFVTIQKVVWEAVSKGIISGSERQGFTSYLAKLDIAADGRYDGGFPDRQPAQDRYISVNHSFAADDTRVRRVNSLISSLFREEKTESYLLLGAKALASVVLFPLFLSGCGGDEHSCSDACGGDLCYNDETGAEICGCPPGKEESECTVNNECVYPDGNVQRTTNKYACCLEPGQTSTRDTHSQCQYENTNDRY